MKKIHWNILDKKCLKMLPQLEFLRKEFGFYLAGGTALALQIGHRTSVDFDFYSTREFNKNNVALASFKEHLDQLTIVQSLTNTIIAKVGDIGVSVFYYDYSLLEPLIRTDYLDLVSIEDIAAMKLIAIIQRGTLRDFIDVYFILKEFTLERLFDLTKKKYPPFNPYVGLRALTYFRDADKDVKQQRFKLFRPMNWNKVKKEIVAKADFFARKGLL